MDPVSSSMSALPSSHPIENAAFRFGVCFHAGCFRKSATVFKISRERLIRDGSGQGHRSNERTENQSVCLSSDLQAGNAWVGGVRCPRRLQLLDAGIGLFEHDPGKCAGPLIIATLQFFVVHLLRPDSTANRTQLNRGHELANRLNNIQTSLQGAVLPCPESFGMR